MILDTTVLIDLQREMRREEPGRASELLEDLRDEEVAIGFVTCMEFAEGYGRDGRKECERFLSLFRTLWPNAETAWRAGQISRALGARGESIGDHDAWIGALALQHGRTVVSANDRHFRRIPGLAVRTY